MLRAFIKSPKESYRFERKYVEAHLSADHFITQLKIHPEGFRTLHPSREILNLYLDTPRMDFFQDNQAGNPQRLKIRIRWYPGQKITQLEYKIKKGSVGTKKIYNLPNVSLKELLEPKSYVKAFSGAPLPEEIKEQLMGLEPALINCYQRSYFGSTNKIFRATVDTHLEFKAPPRTETASY